MTAKHYRLFPLHFLVFLLSVPGIAAQESCAPVTWLAEGTHSSPSVTSDHSSSSVYYLRLISTGDIQPGDINCRYSAITESSVTGITCAELAKEYGISTKTFFVLNPEIALDCANIQPETEYCVAGCKLYAETYRYES